MVLRIVVRTLLLVFTVTCIDITSARAQSPIRIGLAETDITPPLKFPMAGYFHERLNEGTIDPLKAKAIVFRSDSQQAAMVVCDLIGIAADFAKEVKTRASEQTGIPASHIIVSATHSHTAPDYSKSLYAWMIRKTSPDAANAPSLEKDPERLAYIDKLITNTVDAVVKASQSATPAKLDSGWTEQQTPVAFNRRFVQKDGSVKTWVGLEHEGTVRSAGPIDPEIPLLLIRDEQGHMKGLVSNFALHLDTVGGMKWSADYPSFISDVVREKLGPEMISIFGTGCCGDINHVNPRGKERNKTDFIGKSLGDTIVSGVASLSPIDSPRLEVRSVVVQVPLQEASQEAVAKSIATMKAVNAGETVDFYDHVTAHKTLMIDQMRNNPRFAKDEDAMLARRVTHTLSGVGPSIPVEINAICIGQDMAIVSLPGEVFVDLGLAIKRGSPFRNTMVIELSNCVETFYVPTRAAFAGGGYETTNSTVEHGAGELLVEETLKMLKAAAQPANTPAL
ncbi:MAG: hypothetical protein U0996_04570 [Planctomycetaceae bacterium]